MWSLQAKIKWSTFDFKNIRKYETWDPIQHIDWKTSAKLQDIYIKQYEPKRWLDTRLICDIRTLSPYIKTNKEILWAIKTVSYALWYVTLQNNDKLWHIINTKDHKHISEPKVDSFQLHKLLDSYSGKSYWWVDAYIEKMKYICGIETNVFTWHILDLLLEYKKQWSMFIYIHRDQELPIRKLQKISSQNKLIVIDIHSKNIISWEGKNYSLECRWWNILYGKKLEEYLAGRKTKVKKSKAIIESIGGKYLQVDTWKDILASMIRET